MSKKRKAKTKRKQSKAGKPGIPDRKISETLIDFAKPIMEMVDRKTTEDDLKKGLMIAVTVWNAIVISEWGTREDYLKKVRDSILNSEVSEFIHMIDTLVDRKLTYFAYDFRAISSYDVKQKPDGSFKISAEARIEESLLKVH